MPRPFVAERYMLNNRDRSGADFREEKHFVNLPPKPCIIVLIIRPANYLYGRRKNRVITSCICKNECLNQKDLRFNRCFRLETITNQPMIPLEQRGRVTQPA